MGPLLLAIGLAAQAAPVMHIIKGPAVACGAAFRVDLHNGESLSWADYGMDFLAYRFARADGTTIIYEGNAPEPGGIERPTQRDWPSVVAIHGDAATAARVATDGPALRGCPPAADTK